MPPSKEFLDLVGKMQEIHVKKNKDYSGDNDAFFNFGFSAELVSHFKSPIDQVFVSLIGIKLARLSVLLANDTSVNNEPIEDSFLDAANYMALWGARRGRDWGIKKPPTIEELDKILNGEAPAGYMIQDVPFGKHYRCFRCQDAIQGKTFLSDGHGRIFHHSCAEPINNG